MAKQRVESRWVTLAIVAACFAPIAIIGVYVYVAFHFISKFW